MDGNIANKGFAIPRYLEIFGKFAKYQQANVTLQNIKLANGQRIPKMAFMQGLSQAAIVKGQSGKGEHGYS